MPLHPEARAFIATMSDLPQPPDVTVQQFREAANKLVQVGSPLPIGRVEDRIIRGGSGQDLRIRLYVPEGDGPFPVAVWVRGGSFSRTTLDQVDPVRRVLAKVSECIIAAVDQRLSPEAHFPGPLEDAYAAAVWASEHAAEFGGNPARVGIAGESSGANIAAAVTLLARERDGPRLAFQVLFAPLLDATGSQPSAIEFAEGYILTKRQIVWAFQQYAPGQQLTDPLVSPHFTNDVKGLPPAVIVTMEFDPLRDEGELYAERLRAAGVPVKSARIDGMIHHYAGKDAFPSVARMLKDFLKDSAHESNPPA
jgi:acetyl esterase